MLDLLIHVWSKPNKTAIACLCLASLVISCGATAVPNPPSDTATSSASEETVVGEEPIAGFVANTQAETRRLINVGMSQGTTWEVYLLNKKFVKEVTLGGETRRLYLVDLETDSSYSGVSRQTNLVQCSTSQPFVAFPDGYDSGIAILHFLNPGGGAFGYNAGSHAIYWAVCHDLWQAEDDNPEARARDLGYSTQLESDQIEIPTGLLQYLR